MKGYELILLANGVIFVLIGVLVHFNGLTLERQGSECAHGNATQCQRDVEIGETTRRVAPFLFALAVLLLGLSATLILRRRWFGREEPPGDEGPGYP